MFHVCGVFRNVFRDGAPNFDLISSVVFSGRIILKHIENKKGSRGVREHAALENLCTTVAILVLFEQFLGKFFALKLSVLPNIMHFVHTFSIMHA